MLTKAKTRTIQVRITEDDYEYLKEAAYMMGTDSSKLVRQIIQMSINAAKMAKKHVEEDRKRLNKESVLNAESGVDVVAY